MGQAEKTDRFHPDEIGSAFHWAGGVSFALTPSGGIYAPVKKKKQIGFTPVESPLGCS